MTGVGQEGKLPITINGLMSDCPVSCNQQHLHKNRCRRNPDILGRLTAVWSNRGAALHLRMDGSPASRAAALQLEMKADAREGFCWESHHHRKQNKWREDWSEEQSRDGSGDKNCDFSHSFVRLDTKEVMVLSCSNGSVPTRIFRASPSLLVHTLTIIELMLGSTFNK